MTIYIVVGKLKDEKCPRNYDYFTDPYPANRFIEFLEKEMPGGEFWIEDFD